MTRAWYQLDWIWTTTAWLLAIAGAALLLYALFHDRARGRKRCPKCWYTVEGVPSRVVRGLPQFICPECGWRGFGVAALLRTRRKWRIAATACFVGIALPWTTWQGRRIARDGWVRSVPSTVLTYIASPGATATSRQVRLYGADLFQSNSPWRPTTSREAMSMEMWGRIYRNEPWGWQTHAFIRRGVKDEISSFASRVRYPRYCIVREPVLATIGNSVDDGYCVFDLVFSNACPTSKSASMSFDSPGRQIVPFSLALRDTARTVYRETAKCAVEVFASPAELMLSTHDPRTDEMVIRASAPTIVLRPGGGVELAFKSRHEKLCEFPDHLFIDLRVELLTGDEVLATTTHSLSRTNTLLPPLVTPRVTWSCDQALLLSSDTSALLFRIRGDIDLAWQSYQPFRYEPERPAYWNGKVVAVPQVLDLRNLSAEREEPRKSENR